MSAANEEGQSPDEASVVTVERFDHVSLITLNRPSRLNALNKELQLAILAAFEEAKSDDSVRAIVLTGAGRGFCAGADISGAGAWTPDTNVSQETLLDEYGWVGKQALGVFGVDKPTIAAVNGVSVGAGMSLALACDIRVGGPSTRFKTMFIERHLSPDAGMTYFLTRIVGYSRAAELVFTNRDVFAEEALSMGLLNIAVDNDEKTLEAALDLAQLIAAHPPVAMRASKRTLQRNLEVGLSEALLNEKAGLKLAALATNDRAESMQAMREKRPPIFTGS
jgi:2-(1,2-epoxy-1,2-dihydrophenyl)acetyl-CoA isomerase